MKKLCILGTFLMAGCSGGGGEAPPNILGTYHFNGCPDIKIDKDSIRSGIDNIPYELVRIKGSYYLSADNTVLYNMKNGCKIGIDKTPRYIPITSDNGVVSVKVFSDDFKNAVFYTGPHAE